MCTHTCMHPTHHSPHTHTTYSCAFVFVLEVEENRILAEQALLLIGNLVKDYIIKDHSVAEVGHSADSAYIHHNGDRSSAMMKQHTMFPHVYLMQTDGAIYTYLLYIYNIQYTVYITLVYWSLHFTACFTPCTVFYYATDLPLLQCIPAYCQVSCTC